MTSRLANKEPGLCQRHRKPASALEPPASQTGLGWACGGLTLLLPPVALHPLASPTYGSSRAAALGTAASRATGFVAHTCSCLVGSCLVQECLPCTAARCAAALQATALRTAASRAAALCTGASCNSCLARSCLAGSGQPPRAQLLCQQLAPARANCARRPASSTAACCRAAVSRSAKLRPVAWTAAAVLCPAAWNAAALNAAAWPVAPPLRARLTWYCTASVPGLSPMIASSQSSSSSAIMLSLTRGNRPRRAAQALQQCSRM
mmetsp:Transcript_63815/g.186652  ORF Transcript_63815/g.186652 Transcript_63815/m.186652 type:complete len:264 (+) Transcript_63815:419-1210(+)